MANLDKSIIVDGYSFLTSADAETAEAERKKVLYLKSHLDSNNPDTVYALYTKAVSDRIFCTPIGNGFLKELRDYLISVADYSEDEVPAVPVFYSFSSDSMTGGTAKKRVNNSSKTATEAPKKEKGPALFMSIAVNIILIIGIICMFAIALSSDNPNILNYETQLLNKYSYWEQDLTEREAVIREKELELRISE